MTLESAVPLPAALLLAGVVVLGASRSRSLAPSGAMAALVIGTAAMCRSLGWGAFLVTWFVLAALLSRMGRTRKALRTAGIVEKGERRDAWQVLANGAVFAIGAAVLAAGIVPPAATDVVTVAAVAALVAAGADSWATELGTLGGRPWSLRERRRVAIGVSGAVTPVGTVASAAGAFLLASLAGALTVIPQRAVPTVAIAGLAGAFVDTLAGAWWQERRWCPTCNESTEQHVHRCGTATVRRGGFAMMTNDTVNLACTVSGAALAMLLWYLREG